MASVAMARPLVNSSYTSHKTWMSMLRTIQSNSSSRSSEGPQLARYITTNKTCPAKGSWLDALPSVTSESTTSCYPRAKLAFLSLPIRHNGFSPMATTTKQAPMELGCTWMKTSTCTQAWSSRPTRPSSTSKSKIQLLSRMRSSDKSSNCLYVSSRQDQMLASQYIFAVMNKHTSYFFFDTWLNLSLD